MARKRRFRSLEADRESFQRLPNTPQTASPTYRLAMDDSEFLRSESLRGVRLQIEYLKVEERLQAEGVDGTVILFGGARIPAPGAKAEAATPKVAAALEGFSAYYAQARRFAALASEHSLSGGGRDFVVCTGGGPGVMEAGNRGAADVGARSIGLSIVLPKEEAPNAFVTPELCFNFHYFAIRKMHFLMRAKAIAVFPGGFGTLDEMFEALTLVQTGRMAPLPILFFGEAFWRRVITFEALAEAGTISPGDLELFRFVETADEAWAEVAAYHGLEAMADAAAAP